MMLKARTPSIRLKKISKARALFESSERTSQLKSSFLIQRIR